MRANRQVRRWIAFGVGVAAAAALVAAGTTTTTTSATRSRPERTTPVAVPTGISPAPDPGRPNIVFVLTDDLSTDLLRYMPHVRALARSGTTFSNYFVVDSLCCPSRAAILTGQYPHNTRVYYNAGPAGGWDQFVRVGDARKVYGVALRAAGYRTGFMGKYLNHYPPSAPPPAGWDEWAVTGSEGYREFDYHLNVDGRVHRYGSAPKDYLTDVLADRAVRFVDRSAASGRPFALEVATYAPHLPATPAPRDRHAFAALRAPRGPEWDRLPTAAPRWLARYPRLSAADVAGIDAKYRHRVESVQAVDRMVGRLSADLARRGLLTDTYFLFSSDNGFHMGQRRMLPGKQTAYDSDIRVPLIVAGPGVPAGRVDPTLVSSVDLAPTFEQIAGARSTFRPDGTSLLSLWRGHAAPASWPTAVLIEHRSATLPGDPDRQPSRSGLAPSYDALRTRDALYVEYMTGDREYYDLRRDPLELHNVVGQLPPERVQALHELLASLSACRGPDCRR